MTNLRRRLRLPRIRAGLGEQQPDQTETANGDRRETPKRDTATEMTHHVTGERGAERGADTHREPTAVKLKCDKDRVDTPSSVASGRWATSTSFAAAPRLFAGSGH